LGSPLVLLALLRHDRLLVLAGLFIVVVLAWAWLLLGAGIEMEQMDMAGGQVMLMPPEWSPAYAALIVLMWAIMMMAMMLPSAAPAVLLVAALTRKRDTAGSAHVAGLFASGYILVWIGFSLAATALQFGLDRAGLLTERMATASTGVASACLIVAGLYQWTPLKHACLSHCRSPLAFLIGRWRQGALGAVSNGVRYGVFCLGCCWLLMLLLFVGGLMNLLWIAGLATLVLIEKTLPWGVVASRLTGAALIAWGVFVAWNSSA
jgi:predicted metal-binding membrane protein